jgi:hypothetical protein
MVALVPLDKMEVVAPQEVRVPQVVLVLEVVVEPREQTVVQERLVRMAALVHLDKMVVLVPLGQMGLMEVLVQVE